MLKCANSYKIQFISEQEREDSHNSRGVAITNFLLIDGWMADYHICDMTVELLMTVELNML